MIRLLVALLVVSHCLGHQYNVDTKEISTSTETSSSTDSSSSTTSSPTYSSSSTTSSPTTAPVPDATITSISHNKGVENSKSSITVCFQDSDCAAGNTVKMVLRIDKDEHDAEIGTVSVYDGPTYCSTHIVNNYTEITGSHSVIIDVYDSTSTLIAHGIADFNLNNVTGFQSCSSASFLSPLNTLLRVDCSDGPGSALKILRVDYNENLPLELTTTSQSESLKYYEKDDFPSYQDKMLSYCNEVDAILYCHDVGKIKSLELKEATLLSKEVLNYDENSLTLYAPTLLPMNPTNSKFEMVSKNIGPSIVPEESDFTDTIVNNFEETDFDPTFITEYILISKDANTKQSGSIPGYDLHSYVITPKNIEVSWVKNAEKYLLRCLNEGTEFDSVTVHCSSQDCFGYCLSNEDHKTGTVEVTTTDESQTVTASFPSPVDPEELNLFDVKMNWNETDNYSEIEVCLHQPSDNFDENESGSYEALFFNERNEWNYGKELKTSKFDGYICMNWITELESEFISAGEEVDIIILKRDVDGRSVLASGNVKLLV